MSDTPRTDALPRIRQAGETEYVPIDDCRQLERELAEVTKQRDGAFSLIEYAGELLGVTPQEHKSAHGFAILQAIKDLTNKQP
jgi:hypothetical protein